MYRLPPKWYRFNQERHVRTSEPPTPLKPTGRSPRSCSCPAKFTPGRPNSHRRGMSRSSTSLAGRRRSGLTRQLRLARGLPRRASSVVPPTDGPQSPTAIVMRDVRPMLHTASRGAPTDSKSSAWAAVNRIARHLQNAKRATRSHPPRHRQPETELMGGPCDARLRTFSIVGGVSSNATTTAIPFHWPPI